MRRNQVWTAVIMTVLGGLVGSGLGVVAFFLWFVIVFPLIAIGLEELGWQIRPIPEPIRIVLVSFAFSLPIVFLALGALAGYFGTIAVWPRSRPGLCPACDYDLRGSPGPTCPECGAARPIP